MYRVQNTLTEWLRLITAHVYKYVLYFAERYQFLSYVILYIFDATHYKLSVRIIWWWLIPVYGFVCETRSWLTSSFSSSSIYFSMPFFCKTRLPDYTIKYTTVSPQYKCNRKYNSIDSRWKLFIQFVCVCVCDVWVPFIFIHFTVSFFSCTALYSCTLCTTNCIVCVSQQPAWIHRINMYKSLATNGEIVCSLS